MLHVPFDVNDRRELKFGLAAAGNAAILRFRAKFLSEDRRMPAVAWGFVLEFQGLKF